MDPEACLSSLAEAIEDGNPELANELIDSYLNWRVGGGFQPVDGDKRFVELNKKRKGMKHAMDS